MLTDEFTAIQPNGSPFNLILTRRCCTESARTSRSCANVNSVLVHIFQVEGRPVGLDSCEVIGEHIAILGKLPGSREENTAFLLADELMSRAPRC